MSNEITIEGQATREHLLISIGELVAKEEMLKKFINLKKLFDKLDEKSDEMSDALKAKLKAKAMLEAFEMFGDVLAEEISEEQHLQKMMLRKAYPILDGMDFGLMCLGMDGDIPMSLQVVQIKQSEDTDKKEAS